MTVPNVAAVVIGRNEGARLADCLGSLVAQLDIIVYVDSDSGDDSIAIARHYGAIVVELDHTAPFTAARARNAGFERLMQHSPIPTFVQFVDGDCELQAGWLALATRHLDDHPEVAIVCGRRRERHPEASAYNQLCDMEWNTPVGEAASCGGDALIRAAPFQSAGGFDPALIAGEEPDLCYRLRRNGWKIHRIAGEMTIHDAAMTTFAQWWQRSRRSGYADMEASRRRGHDEPRLPAKVRSNFFWGQPLAWPLWPLLWLRVRSRHGALYATHIVAGKVPHLLGQLSWWHRHIRGGPPALIEYK